MQPVKITKTKIAIVFILLVITSLAFMAARDQRRHEKLEKSVSILQTKLGDHDIDADMTSGCGRPYVEFGRGDKSCSISLRSSIPTGDSSAAEIILREYSDIVNSTARFTSNGGLPDSLPNADGFNFGYATYYDRTTGKVCSVDYDYDKGERQTTVGFSCDDTSWYLKTFNF